MSNAKTTPIIYLAQLEGTKLAKKREILRLRLEELKRLPHDKKEFKKKRDAIVKEMNALTFDINGKMAEMYKQNFKVVQYMLMMFVGMDFVTRLYDEAAEVHITHLTTKKNKPIHEPQEHDKNYPFL